MVDRAVTVIAVKTGIVMWHTVLQVDHTRTPVGVAITNNPLEFDGSRFMAQVVMHKTRSHNCAVQVARYVRRRFDIEVPVTTHRATRPMEAKIGYACSGGYQHEPNERTPGWGEFQHIAATSIKVLLEEVAGGHNAAGTRYTVYEVRGAMPDGTPIRLRGVTNRYNAVELRFRQCPPDTLRQSDVAFIARCASPEEAAKHGPIVDHSRIEALWTRKPPMAYMNRVLKLDPIDGILWASDGTSAVRRYETPCVVIGPHVYTERQVLYALERGQWLDGRTVEGLMAKYG